MLDLPERIEFELGWLALGFLFGVSFLAYVPPGAVAALLPSWFIVAWALAWLLGTLIGVSGTVASTALGRTRRYWGLVGERAGLTLHAASASTWAIAGIYLWAAWPDEVRPHTPFPVVTVSLAGVWLGVSARRIVRTSITIRAMTAIEPKGEPTEE